MNRDKLKGLDGSGYFSISKTLFITLFFTAIVITLIICIKNYHTREGEKIGNIVKISRDGLMCKTYEGELIRGNLNQGNGSFGQQFDFTVEDELVKDQLISYMENSIPVKVKYYSRFSAPCDSGNKSNNFVYEVKPIKGDS